MIAASIGVGKGKDSHTAGAEACTQAISGLPKGKDADALIVFGSTTFDQDALVAGVTSVAPNAILIGCSTAGEISSEGFSTYNTVVVMAICSDQARFWGAIGNHILWNARLAGEECANTLTYNSNGYISSCLTFLDVLSGSGDETIRGMTNKLGDTFPVTGGASGDEMLFFETYQYLQNKVYRGSIVGMGLSGDYHTASVAMHGFLPIGISRVATRSEGTTLFELDGKPASSIYEEYFGEDHVHELHDGLLPALAVAYPLGVFTDDNNDVVLRNPIFVDQKGAMTFASGIPEKSEIRLMISDIDRGLETAERAAREVLKKLQGRTPKAIIVVNSAARKKMFGLRADEEIEIIQRIIGRDVPIAGYYSYAQVGGQSGERVQIHNGSLLLWAIAE
ncbi:MAG: hypothetical protein UY04_C0001G0020 [Parcubacteria group bacterium GW2011_GWA2_47_7]|nr:MAG: hypothetical protein UY04_C0001G0020 [Parcubacteria group bacterium GW2011_GWA2_47_7]